jgi:predicted RNase H-like HicB family nuclease
MRQVIIYPGEDDYWVAECPSLPGCVSQGKTKKEAIEGYIKALEEDGLPVPEDEFEAMLISV